VLSSAHDQDEASTKVTAGNPASTLVGDKLTFEPGTRLEHYEIIRELGRGGMGVVYLARDMQLGRRVAIKFLVPRHREEADRFLREARATARCDHENIVVVHAVNLRDDVPYMVLEYLDGSSLDAYLEGRSLPAMKAVELIVPVVRALARAHEFGIIHRDLKPANIFVTRAGVVKVFDFGIAKAVTDSEVSSRAKYRGVHATDEQEVTITELGSEIGTARYMAPEQWGVDTVDFRTDFWAIGVILYRMVTGTNPLAERSIDELRAWAHDLDDPIESVSTLAANLPDELVAVIDRCLEKRKSERFVDAKALLDELEPLLPGRYGHALDEDECPYPGLAAFQQSDANRYFGRTAEIRRALVTISDRPLLAVVGPSGFGKSSFVRAGLMPSLRNSGDPWEMFDIRPGRRPLASLANLCRRLEVDKQPNHERADDESLTKQLRSQPGLVGTLLRERARIKGRRILVFVDQFEELYTLVADADERAAFAQCLLALADDVASPLRVVVSMRSDFLDRVAEHDELSIEMTRGLMLLPALERAAIRIALTQPAELAGYRFEDDATVDTMLDEMDATPGALSLLQFAAARLWQKRDRQRRLLTRESYRMIGGIAGTLAAHADATLAGLAPSAQKIARTIFTRLVTPERTRAIVDVSELAESSDDSRDVIRVVDQLVQSRLLVTDVRGTDGDAVVELVHESLITSWPTLHRWLEETQEDATFLAQLREVARQWEGRGRPPGLLWRGDALDDARRFMKRHRGALPSREKDYLDDAFRLASRNVRLRRTLIVGAFSLLTCFALGASVALVEIRKAEQSAREAEQVARESELTARNQASLARQEAERAQAAEQIMNEQLDLLRKEERARRAAESVATDASKSLSLTNEELAKSNRQLQAALLQAEQAAQTAADATAAERESSKQLENLLEKERERVKELKRQRGKIIDDLR
jgi:eukaryotic-like serine/threonine-protein kinase